MSKIVKGLLRFLIELAVITVLLVGGSTVTNGMPLFGVPDVDDIQSVQISYPAADSGIETSSREDVELPQNLTSFLYYAPFAPVDSEEEPAITITYFLRDGVQKTVAASDTTVWWNGKAHRLKHPGQFVKMAEGVFSPQPLPAE